MAGECEALGGHDRAPGGTDASEGPAVSRRRGRKKAAERLASGGISEGGLWTVVMVRVSCRSGMRGPRAGGGGGQCQVTQSWHGHNWHRGTAGRETGGPVRNRVPRREASPRGRAAANR